MKIGDMEFTKINGTWVLCAPKVWNDNTLNEVLDYIESHGLDKADEKIADLSRLCEAKEEKIIHLSCSNLVKDQKISDLKEPSYKQRFIDEAAIALFARPEFRHAADAWGSAEKLWNARKVEE